MKTAKPHGKGLTGFIVGLLLATVIIGGLVYTLESSRKRDFKAPIEEKELTPPEILSPKKPEPKPEPQQPASEAKPEPEPLPPDSGRTTDRETPEQPEPDSAPDNGKEPDAADDSDIIPGVPSPLTEEGKNGKKDQTRRDQKRRDKAKPTPEQILNGKIGRDQKRADREAERRKAEAALSGQATANPSRRSSGNGGSVVVQAGSYGSRDKAESQRAKLAAAGVDTRVVEAQVQGKTMYRVQTAPVSAADAAQTRRELQSKGIDSFARPAQ
ncbi:SPOR domain-containing protein [Kingella potus]|uniref:SPOR domain-containing protein n=1 Tax=Kingella potus TaxID=265175 RepID=UPI000E1B9F11|nr:SPOR domain-containing protein [Kingella potus]